MGILISSLSSLKQSEFFKPCDSLRRVRINVLKQVLLVIFIIISFQASANETIKGDVNNDGEVNIADVNFIINQILSEYLPIHLYGDVNEDGEVNIADVNVVINIILGNNYEPPEFIDFEVNNIHFKMIYVKGGTFTMGATSEQLYGPYDYSYNYRYELPTHEVTLSNYYIGETEVTGELWKAVMADNTLPVSYDYYDYAYDLKKPLDQASYSNALSFCQKLSNKTGYHFRLPTEAEWEYAARGGCKSKGYRYSGSDNIKDVAWYGFYTPGSTAYGTSKGPHRVAEKAPNELGLYDMSGNVYEWCQGWYYHYTSEPQVNPTAPEEGYYRIMRGGCWLFDPSSTSPYHNHFRVSWRGVETYYRYNGFRIVMEMPEL